MKKSKNFTFLFPLKHKAVRDLKIVTEHVGDLVVEGVGYFDPSYSSLDIYDRYSVDIDFIKWNDTDIKAVLEVTGFIDDIHEAAIRHFAGEMQQSLNRAA